MAYDLNSLGSDHDATKVFIDAGMHYVVVDDDYNILSAHATDNHAFEVAQRYLQDIEATATLGSPVKVTVARLDALPPF